MTNLSLKNRELLSQKYEVGATPPVHEMRSVDGTVKYLFRTPENDYIELYIFLTMTGQHCVCRRKWDAR